MSLTPEKADEQYFQALRELAKDTDDQLYKKLAILYGRSGRKMPKGEVARERMIDLYLMALTKQLYREISEVKE